jgi:hypothetical protein
MSKVWDFIWSLVMKVYEIMKTFTTFTTPSACDDCSKFNVNCPGFLTGYPHKHVIHIAQMRLGRAEIGGYEAGLPWRRYGLTVELA